MVVGLAFVSLSMASLSLIGVGTSLWWVRTLMFVIGLGQSCMFIPAQAASFATIAPASIGRASTLFNTGRQLGGAIGVALLTTVIATAGSTRVVAGHVLPNLGAYHASFIAAAVVEALAILVALTVRDADAAGTMVRRGRLAQRPPRVAMAAEVAST